MRIARRVSLAVVLVAPLIVPAASSHAQTVVTTGTPTPSAPGPDIKAFTDANKITEPDKRIEALEKFLREYPDSMRKTAAYDAVFTTLIKNFPQDKQKILDYADRIIESSPESMRSSGYSRVATRLLDADILLDDAARLTEKGIEVFESEERKRTERGRAAHLANLGRIRLKQGRTDEGEKALKAAFAANPELTAATVGLAELAQSRGDNTAALDYWSTAALTGRLSQEDRQRFETLYAKVSGSSAGLDAMLDAKYRSLNPPVLHPESYKPTAARSDRVVLAEVFTGAGCPPCVSVDLAFDAAAERYARKDLALLMYHVHIPAPDPLTNKATETRAKYYNVTGVPTYTVDGEVGGRGGGDRSAAKTAYDRLVPQLDKALEVAAASKLQLEAARSGQSIKVRATPSGLKPEGGDVVLQIALAEEMLSYSGENGVRFHPMAVRSLAGENAAGIKVDRTAPAAVEWEFDVARISADIAAYLDNYEKNGPRGKITFSRKPSAIGDNLAVIAFLQDDQSKKVLQSAYVRIGGSSATSSR